MALATQMSQQPKARSSVFSSFVSKTSSSTQPAHGRCAEMERLEKSMWVSLQRFLLGIFICIDMPGWESTWGDGTAYPSQ